MKIVDDLTSGHNTGEHPPVTLSLATPRSLELNVSGAGLHSAVEVSRHILARDARPVAVRAEGVWVWDSHDRAYLDASSGAVVSSLGHGHPAVVKAVTDQLRSLDSAHRSQFDNAPAQRLASRLAECAGMDGGRCYFFSSGSEAIDAAIRLATLYQHLERGPQGPPLTRTVSYHGATIEALSLTGHRGKRRPYDDLLPYRATLPPLEPAQGSRAWDTVHRDLHALPPVERPRALLLETLPGASAGLPVPSADYYPRVRQLCDDVGALWVADEVMTGVGRTGHWFAYQHWNVTPDIVCIGKGLGAGYVPLSAVVVSAQVADVVLEAAATPVGHTYSNHPPAMAAGNAVLDLIIAEDLLTKVTSKGEILRGSLLTIARSLADGHVSGLGLLLALHFDAAVAGFTQAQLVQACFDRGLLVYPAPPADPGSTSAVILSPPFTVSEEDIGQISTLLAMAVEDLKSTNPYHSEESS